MSADCPEPAATDHWIVHLEGRLEAALEIYLDICPRELWRVLRPHLGQWTKANFRKLAELVKAEG